MVIRESLRVSSDNLARCDELKRTLRGRVLCGLRLCGLDQWRVPSTIAASLGQLGRRPPALPRMGENSAGRFGAGSASPR